MTARPETRTARTPRQEAPSPLTIAADVVLLDIEGTISPLSFVRDVLFAYSRERLAGFIAGHRNEPAVASLLDEASALSGGADPAAALADWQDRDVKAPPLKKLQGLIWEQGYRSGAFRSPLFPDALAALRRWHAGGWPLAIYSSGSVKAQHLFFEFSAAGDLRPLFSRHFDTDIGSKVEAASYARIADDIRVTPGRIVFFSDAPKELEAARAAGLETVHVLKDNTPSDPDFAEISDFGEVALVRA
jgi:enolase-phosphatase E1